jgi:uncharacterized membrane-anchored protein YhcB (DUF1043 family)
MAAVAAISPELIKGVAEALTPKTTVLGVIGKIFGFSILSGMAIGTIVSGYESSKVDNAKSQIADLNKLNDSMKEKLTNANKQIIDMTEDTKKEFEELMAQYINLKDEITQSSLELADSFKKIQQNGIIVAIVVFFLLTLKQFDLLDTIYSIILYPFIYIYRSIVNIIKNK